MKANKQLLLTSLEQKLREVSKLEFEISEIKTKLLPRARKSSSTKKEKHSDEE